MRLVNHPELSKKQANELANIENANVVRWFRLSNFVGHADVFSLSTTEQIVEVCQVVQRCAQVEPTAEVLGFHTRSETQDLLTLCGYQYEKCWTLEIESASRHMVLGCTDRNSLVRCAMCMARFDKTRTMTIEKFARVRYVFKGHDIKSFPEVPYSNMLASEWV